MKKIKKQLIGSMIVNVLSFAFLSYVFISLMIEKQRDDVILFYAVSCFLMVVWIVFCFFFKQIHHFLYPRLHKSLEDSWSVHLFGIEIPSEEESFRLSNASLFIFPYVSFLFLSIGLFILYLS